MRLEDDEVPSNDWFEHYVHKTISNCEVIDRWQLGLDSFVSVILNKNDVRIHVREYSYMQNANESSSPKGVMMLPSTWNEFQEKIYNFNTVYAKASFIANNQLAVFSTDDESHLQQIFKSGEGYTFKPSYVKLVKEQLDVLREYIPEINECVRETLLCRALPNIILNSKRECSQNVHLTEEETTDKLFSAIQNELITVLNKLYFCLGCTVAHPSQRRHDCLNSSELEKYNSVGEQSILCLNYKSIGAELSKKCVCHFSRDFFSKFSGDDYVKRLENMF